MTGTLDRLDHITQFSEFGVHAHLCVPDGVDEASAARALAKAKHACLITNSLKAPMQLDVSVEACKNGPEEPTKVAIEEPVRPAAKTAA